MIGCKVRGKDVFVFLEDGDIPTLRQKEKISGDLINLQPTLSLGKLELAVNSEVCTQAKRNLVVECDIKLGVLRRVNITIPGPAYYALDSEGFYDGDSEKEPVYLASTEKMGLVHRRVYEALSAQRLRLK
jgi:hypothetical protein